VKALVLVAIAACGGGKQLEAEAAPSDKPVAKLDPIKDALCVTKGAAAIGSKITAPTMRAVALGSAGDAASVTFTFRGDSDTVRELASGQARRQLGLKLRAMNGCNLVYVMWRLDPKPKLDVSIKLNPGMQTHKDCGADGYTKLKPTKSTPVPDLTAGGTHTLRAEITGDELLAWIDDVLAWRGVLPDAARSISGPAGIRSDNLMFDLVAFSAPVGGKSERPAPKCVAEESD
jgi:hypothetical protein